ncbi:MAG: DUF998 domain-containing protein [Promethearchaeota archaeon]|nr:MAG: DUF998 domain-containing protein [Candidatus Lokiarchaeota archaeon]
MKLKERQFFEQGYGALFGIISITIALIGITISYLTFPGYTIIKYTVSMLGVGPLGLGFNIGFIISGVLAIPYYLNLSYHFQTEEMPEQIITASILASMISCVSYIFVGIFPQNFNVLFLYAGHIIFAFITFTTGALYLILFGYLMYQSNSFSKVQGIYSFLLCISYFTFIFTQIPLFEWVALFGLVGWLTINSIYLFSLKHTR